MRQQENKTCMGTLGAANTPQHAASGCVLCKDLRQDLFAAPSSRWFRNVSGCFRTQDVAKLLEWEGGSAWQTQHCDLCHALLDILAGAAVQDHAGAWDLEAVVVPTTKVRRTTVTQGGVRSSNVAAESARGAAVGISGSSHRTSGRQSSSEDPASPNFPVCRKSTLSNTISNMAISISVSTFAVWQLLSGTLCELPVAE